MTQVLGAVDGSTGQMETEAPTELPRTNSDSEAPNRLLSTFYFQATKATSYWRCELPAKFLPGAVHPAPQLATELTPDGKILFPDVANGVAIMQFPGDQGTAVCLMAMESQGLKFFVEVDDNYLDRGDELWRLRAGWGREIGSTPHTTQGHRWITEHATGVLVTTEALAEAYREANDNVHVCRNTIDPDDWPELDKPDDGIFRIGWYASGSHDRDEIQCRKAIAWASRQPNVDIVNIGLNPGWPITRTQFGWREDFKSFRPELMKLDVGISPLVGTPMTPFRSDLKALEYSMSGAMPILQALRPYDEWRDKEFARMCWSQDDWMKAMKWALANRDEVRQRGIEAREYVLRERTFKTEIDCWRKAIESERDA